MTDPLALTWLNVILVALLFGFGFTIGTFVANAILNVARRDRTTARV